MRDKPRHRHLPPLLGGISIHKDLPMRTRDDLLRFDIPNNKINARRIVLHFLCKVLAVARDVGFTGTAHEDLADRVREAEVLQVDEFGEVGGGGAGEDEGGFGGGHGGYRFCGWEGGGDVVVGEKCVDEGKELELEIRRGT